MTTVIRYKISALTADQKQAIFKDIRGVFEKHNLNAMTSIRLLLEMSSKLFREGSPVTIKIKDAISELDKHTTEEL